MILGAFLSPSIITHTNRARVGIADPLGAIKKAASFLFGMGGGPRPPNK